MKQIFFYRQERADGGVRTGAGVQGSRTELHSFQPGTQESDPALVWYVDIQVELPIDDEEDVDSRQVLLEMGNHALKELRSLQQRLEVGIDAPLEKQSIDTEGRKWTIRTSSIRGLAAGELARKLGELANDWDNALRQLEPEKDLV